jgi:hypothetical protein
MKNARHMKGQLEFVICVSSNMCLRAKCYKEKLQRKIQRMFVFILMSMHSCIAQPVKLGNFGTNYFIYFLIKILKIEIY